MLNKINIQGRLTQDLELRHTPNGVAVMNATLAVQRSRKDADGSYPADFFDCIFWGKTAEMVAEKFSKGDMVIVDGRMESRKWEDKEGKKRISWELHVNDFNFCGSSTKPSEAQDTHSAAPAAPMQPQPDDEPLF